MLSFPPHCTHLKEKADKREANKRKREDKLNTPKKGPKETGAKKAKVAKKATPTEKAGPVKKGKPAKKDTPAKTATKAKKRKAKKVSTSESDDTEDRDFCMECGELMPMKMDRNNSVKCKECERPFHLKCVTISGPYYICVGCDSDVNVSDESE